MTEQRAAPMVVEIRPDLFWGEKLGVWLPIGHGLEVMARAADNAGSFRLRAAGSTESIGVLQCVGQEVPIPGSAYALYAEWSWPGGPDRASAGDSLGAWVPIGHGLEVMARAVDPAGSFNIRAVGSPESIHLPETAGLARPIPGSSHAVYVNPTWPVGRIELRPLAAP